MKVVSIDEMRRIDKLAQEKYGFDGYDLMAAAGKAIAEECLRIYQPETICVVCGKGNNAGDGFVAAAELYQMGKAVSIYCAESPDSYSGAAKTAWEKLASKKITIVEHEKLKETLSQCDLIVDALLGTGIKGAARENYAALIRLINESGNPVVSADVPSGLHESMDDDSDGEVVRASVTLTIGLPKTMLLLLPGAEFAGRVIVLTISFPQELLESDEWKLNWAPNTELAEWLPNRKLDSNKGTFGHVGVIGSAVSYAGASVLVSRSALRSGCGLVTIYTLSSTNSIYKTALPEATSVILNGDENFFDKKSAASFSEQLKKHSVLAIGPGLGTHDETAGFLETVLSAWDGPTVIDADALNLISDGRLDLLKNRQDCLITPHPGEMSRLTGLSIPDIQANRTGVVRDFAVKHGITVLLKGAGTLVARPDGQVWLVPGSSPALAKGGTGDVLTGATASLIAQGMSPWQAAVVGATAHLSAGQHCGLKFGTRGVLASEVADEIPLRLDAIEKSACV